MQRKKRIIEFIIVFLFIIIGAGARLLPHLPNFTPIAAIALFAGVYLSKRTAFFLPIAIMLISDIFIGFYDIKIMFFVYFSFGLSVLLGLWLKNNKKWRNIIIGSILASLAFFVITNFAVWVFTPWYAKTIEGLAKCYLLAIPFFRNSLMGDLFYSTLFFGAYGLIQVFVEKKFKDKEIVLRDTY